MLTAFYKQFRQGGVLVGYDDGERIAGRRRFLFVGPTLLEAREQSGRFSMRNSAGLKRCVTRRAP